jgi:hypothetical protein
MEAGVVLRVPHSSSHVPSVGADVEEGEVPGQHLGGRRKRPGAVHDEADTWHRGAVHLERHMEHQTAGKVGSRPYAGDLASADHGPQTHRVVVGHGPAEEVDQLLEVVLDPQDQ